MSWGFENDDEFQPALDWMDEFVRTKVEPLDMILDDPYDVQNPDFIKLVRPLQAEVQEQGLWACHLGPELGGQGFGQLKLALMNEILGRASFCPDHLWLPGTRHRQRRNPRPLWHRTTQGRLPTASPRWGNCILLFHDRTARWG